MGRTFRVFFAGFIAIVFSGCTASMTPLMQAIDKGDLASAAKLLDEGADINAGTQCDQEMPEFESYTVLGCAARNGRTEAVRLLLDKGADINKRWGGYRFGFWNPTPLMLAAREGRTNTVKLLLDRGAQVNLSSDLGGWKALTLAAGAGHNEIVKALLDKGASVNETNGNGLTPLIFAAGSGQREAVKILLARGADVNAKNLDGVTALSNAAHNGCNDIVKVLADSGADIDAALIALESGAISSKDPSTALKYKQGIKTVEKYAKKQEPGPPQASVPATQANNTAFISDVDKPKYHLPENENKFAIVIGIEKYSEIPEASYAERDALAVRDHLAAMGFPKRNIILLTGQKATRTGMAKNLEAWLPNNIKRDSTVFFYFSGHGAPDPISGEAYLVPFDGDPNYIAETGYSLSRLYQSLGQLKAARVTVVLDSCFSGAGGRSVLARGARPLVMSAQPKPLAPNLLVLSAAQGSQISTSSTSRGHGLLTYYYLKALNEGNMNIDDIYKYLKPKVEDEARSLNISQSPSLQKGF